MSYSSFVVSLSIDMKLYSPHSRSSTPLSLEPLRVDGISTSRLQSTAHSNHRTRPRPKSATISTFSTRRNERFQQRQRPMTAGTRSKKALLEESGSRLYPQRHHLIPHRYSPDEISRALRLQRQYEKTLQKRSRRINQRTKPKFRSLTRSMSCHSAKIRDSKQSLYETPYHSMNVDDFDYRVLNKPIVAWDSRMYVKPKKTDHLATRTQTVSLNTTESYKRIGSMLDNMYRGSVKDFFGDNYDLRTGLDPNYVHSKQKRRPIYP